MRLVLASASPRRRALLAELGVPFEVVPSDLPEALTPALPVPAAVAELARAKARAVAGRLAGPLVVLAADTVVVVDGRVLGKPATREEARCMLRALRDRTHEVTTGVALVRVPDGTEAAESVVTRVTMRAFTDAELEAYLETGEPADKAGAYAVQGAGGRLVAAVEGCYSNVVGLPLTTTARLLRGFGLPARVPAAGGADPGRPR